MSAWLNCYANLQLSKYKMLQFRTVDCDPDPKSNFDMLFFSLLNHRCNSLVCGVFISVAEGG